MSASLTHHYWNFNLSPYIFQVQELNLAWSLTWWGISLLILAFLSAYIIINKFCIKLEVKKFLNTSLGYILAILLILVTLQKLHINWGLRWYSTMYMLSFLTFYVFCLWSIKKKSLILTEQACINLISFLIIGMLIGARIAYVFIYNFDYYQLHPWEAFATWRGGLSFHGGIIGIIIALIVFCKKYKIPFFYLSDKLVLITPIGIGLGRLGNFMNGELWGRPIIQHVPWAIVFPNAGPMPRHPSQLYQSLGEGFFLFITLFIINRYAKKQGILSACFLIFYCIYRFIVEYFRAADAQVNYYYLNNLVWAPNNAYPNTQWWQILTMGQILCCVFLLVGIGLLIFIKSFNFAKKAS